MKKHILQENYERLFGKLLAEARWNNDDLKHGGASKLNWKTYFADSSNPKFIEFTAILLKKQPIWDVQKELKDKGVKTDKLQGVAGWYLMASKRQYRNLKGLLDQIEEIPGKKGITYEIRKINKFGDGLPDTYLGPTHARPKEMSDGVDWINLKAKKL